MQRAVSWQNIKDIKGYLRVENSGISNMTQEPQEEKFTNTLKISPYIYRNSDTTIPSNLNGFETYIYLAEGMKPDGNLYIDSPYKFNSIKHNGLFFKSEQEYIDFIHNHMKVEIDENAKDASGKYTNRVMIKIIFDFSDEPLDYTALIESTTIMSIYRNMFKINVPVKISYDDYIIYGSSYKTNAYIYPIDDTLYTKKDTSDFNLNGNLTEGYCDSVNITSSIISSISTQQDVQVSVLTEKTNGLYISSTKTPTESSLDSEYIYRLRVRTGQNNVTNLVIYDSIEESAKNSNGDIVPAYGSKDHWHGEFLGIDTSYAESKGYVVKPFYSENPLAGNLYNDDGSLNADWKEYDRSVTNIYEYGEPETITSPNWPSNYDANMTEASNYWEINKPGAESLEIIFDSTCKLESATYDYLKFYDKNGNNITSSVCGISANKIGGTDMAGKTYTIPGDYVKITMRTDGSGQYKGFSANVDAVGNKIIETHYATDRSKVKALAFEYLDAEGNPAKLPANSLTYVLIKMKSPADENITSLAYNGCRTQWQALDDYDRPVDFITGINSNIVKVSLPNSVEDKAVNLHFNKTIDGSQEAFDKLKLDKEGNYNFFITLENQETGDIIKGLVNNKDGFTVNNIPVGTYIIRELDGIWFQFVTMAMNESIEGIELKEESGGYIIIINASVESGTAADINITNKTDEERFYDNKYDVKNLFSPTT